MSKINKGICTGMIAAITLCPALAAANDYHFLHQSAKGLGTAYSTNGTAGNDISSMFSNPSSIIRFGGTRASAGFVLDLPRSKLENATRARHSAAAPCR